MNCKFCGAELEEENLICPTCGKDNAEAEPEMIGNEAEEVIEETAAEATEETAVELTEETAVEANEETAEEPAPKKKGSRIGIIVACVALVLALAAALWYGTNGGWAPKDGGKIDKMLSNELTSKESYTADEEDFASKNNVVIATVGDKTLTNEQLQVYFWSHFYDFLNYYGSYLSYMGLDYTQPLDNQISIMSEEEMTWQHYFLDLSLNAWHRYQALVIKAEQAGVELNEETALELEGLYTQLETTAVENGYENAAALIKTEMGPGATIDAYIEYLSLYYLSNQYFEEEYLKLMPTEAEVEAYFAENAAMYEENGITKDTRTIDVRHILVKPEGGTTDESGNVTYSEEEWETCRLNAEAILETWQNGEKTEESFAELANTFSTDGGSNTNGGLYEGVYHGDMVEAFDAWCFDLSRQIGDTGLVRTNYGYHVMYFSGFDADLWYAYAEEDMMAERGDELINSIMEEYPMEVDYKKIIIGALPMHTEAAENAG